MDNNLKTEFKDFISELSTDICKSVLIEDLKDINNSFNETSNNYKTISDTYSDNIDGIKKQLDQLQATNEKLDIFVTSIDTNSDKVSRALDLIDGGHKEVIDNIIIDNKKLFDEYSKDVQNLNINERKQFISELILSMDSQNKKYIEEIEDLLNRINLLSNKVDFVDSQVKEVKKNLEDSEKRIISEITNKVGNTETKVTNIIANTETRITNIIVELNNSNINKIDKLTVSSNRKNNIIIGLIVFYSILAVVLVLLFK